MSDPLARIIADTAAQPRGVRLRVGTIAATSPLTMTISGTAVDASVLDSYTPVVNDRVAALQDEGRLLIIGKLT